MSFNIWVVEEFMCVDKTTVNYYGQNNFMYFICGILIRFGYKLWALRGRSGHCFSFSRIVQRIRQTAKQIFRCWSRKQFWIYLSVLKTQTFILCFYNTFTNRDIMIHIRYILYRNAGTIRKNHNAHWILKSGTELKKQDRGIFDYHCHCDEEEPFVCWNDNKYDSIGTNFDSIDFLAAVTRRNNSIKQMVNTSEARVLTTYN